MKLTSLHLHNYRCFEDFEIKFDPKHNLHVLIAENMVGKSALLGGIKVAIGSWFLGSRELYHHRILPRDHRISSGRITFEEREPYVSISAKGEINGEKIDNGWVREKTKTSGDTLYGNAKQIKGIASYAFDMSRHQKWASLPLLLNISTEYIFTQRNLTKKNKWTLSGPRHQGYLSALSDGNMEKYVLSLYREVEEAMNKLSRNSEIARDIYGDFPKVASNLYHKILPVALGSELKSAEMFNLNKEDTFLLKFSNYGVVSYKELSDGYKYLVLLFSEIFTRALLLNPFHSFDQLQNIEGVVLIDEFGIHLHPSLQKDALNRLRATFPKIQFIVTTHSPLLLNGLEREQVHILEMDSETGKRTVRHPDTDIVGLGAEGILLDVFGLPTTYDAVTIKRLERFRELARKRQVERLTVEEMKEYEDLHKDTFHDSFDGLSDPLYAQFRKALDYKIGQLKNKASIKSAPNEVQPQLVEELINSLFS